MSAEVKATVKTILELLSDNQLAKVLNVNESDLPDPPITSVSKPLLKSLRCGILDSAVMKIVSSSVGGNPVTEIHYKEC